MKIGYVMTPGKGDTDRLLLNVAERLLERGNNPLGLVQINSDNPLGGPCDMDVRILPDGPVLRISQSLGREARGCRLDADALETAVGLVNARLPQGASCLIINKFGKQEASGRGFCDVIAEAIAQDIPIVVGVNPLNEEAFAKFADGYSELLPADPVDILRWLDGEDLISDPRNAA